MEEAKEISKSYDPKINDSEIMKLWEESGFFNPDNLPGKRKKPFSMVLPPPNVTGTLHLGHSLMLVIQDILIRYHRMKGFKTLWVPGTDHAAIATQEKVEKELYKKEEKTRHDLGRENFLARVEKFASESHDIIVNQIKKMGASIDWSREAFTLDEKRNLAVKTAFKKMYDAGLIYRGKRIVNWDPKLQTTVSDDETDWTEEKTKFYYLKYGPFTIGTARPETKFGDKYVVMHPKDKRYAKYKHGEKMEVEWINGKINATIIKDVAVDPKFGTGVMTITPWHDAVDFDIAKRHNLDMEPIIDLRGKLLPIAGEFADKKIKEARELIIEKLKSKGLVEKIDENYLHRIATSSRGGGTIEPQVLEQWFVDVNKKFILPKSNLKGIKSGSETTLKEIMQKTVKGGQIKIVPERFKKIYFHWIENLHDWCISRQIWYGHRIPVWYDISNKNNRHGKIYFKKDSLSWSNLVKGSNSPGEWAEFSAVTELVESGKYTWEKIKNSAEEISTKRCDSLELNEDLIKQSHIQDFDTLDTWFSSGLWTFSTLGWPLQETNGKPSEDFINFHPTSVIETGPDILFFWIARMILMSGFLLGDIPFEKVYLHGIVRDKNGLKMSKSKNNGIDPLDMIEKFGTDALRISMISGISPGNDVNFSEDKTRGYRNFATKLWNIGRFIKMNEVGLDKEKIAKAKLNKDQKEKIAKAKEIKKNSGKNIEKFKFHEASYDLYHYAWHEFADKIIEESKPALKSEDFSVKASSIRALREMFFELLIALHPFMPYVTEAIYQELFSSGDKKDLLMVKDY